jgi:uncharacterized protein
VTAIPIGQTPAGATASLPLRFANRHGLVTGATGTGKTTTLQHLAEQFSRAGVPVFAADVKGDLSGIAAGARPCPAAFWDIFGDHGLKIRTSVHTLGPELLASMLRLNETQYGTLAIAFKKARDEGAFFLTLDDLRWALNDMLELREEICRRYGNVTASSIAAIQRNLLALEAQGGHNLFGEPPFRIADFLKTDEHGQGVVNLLHADQLLEAPKLYATFLLWLLVELFRELPEAGDLAKPKLVFFFDEAHLLFRDAPKPLLQQVERLVRLVRSKGVGVWFVTQSPIDVPDSVLAQLGNRIQHALRVYTPKETRIVKAAAQAFRPNKGVDVKSEIVNMGIGEALVSVMVEDGVPSPVEKVKVQKPESQLGPIDNFERDVRLRDSPLTKTYSRASDPAAEQRAFVDRMRAENNLPPIDWQADQWREGDFAKFIPQIEFEPEKKPDTKPRGLLALAGLGAAIAFFWYAGVL